MFGIFLMGSGQDVFDRINFGGVHEKLQEIINTSNKGCDEDGDAEHFWRISMKFLVI